MFGRLAICAASLALLGAKQFPGHDAPDSSQAEWARQCGDWEDWDKPGPAFRVYGNTWYVGTCGISAILIIGEDGHILIDGGTAQGADIIAKNIAAAGFDIRDVRIILFSHEHHDHVGGLARLQELSGAVVLSSAKGRASMETGAASPDDPQKEIAERFAPVRVAGIAEDNMSVKLGNLTVFGLETPGHTPGAMSWQWSAPSIEGKAHMTLNYFDSLSPISADGYRFSDHPEYLAGFRQGLDRLKHVGCGILLTPHPTASAMRARIVEGGLTEYRPGCAAYVESIEKRLADRLAKEAEAK